MVKNNTKFRERNYKFSDEEFEEYISQFELTPYQQKFYLRNKEKKKKYGRGENHYVFKSITKNRNKVRVEIGYTNDYDVDSSIMSMLLAV